MANTTTAEDKKRKVDQELEKDKIKNIKEDSNVVDQPTTVQKPSPSKSSKAASPVLKSIEKNSPELKSKSIGEESGKVTPTEKSKNVDKPTSPKRNTTPLELKSQTKDPITPEASKDAEVGPKLESKAAASKTKDDPKPQEGFWARYTRENSGQSTTAVVPVDSTPNPETKSAFTPVKSDFWAKYSKDNQTSAFSSPTKPKVDFQTLLKQSGDALGSPKTAQKLKFNSDKEDQKGEKKEDWKELETVTGEEDEDTLAVFRCRLYHSIDGEWKERGVGNLKINALDGGYRFVMRSDAVLKVILNCRIFKTMPIHKRDKYLEFAVVEDGKLQKFLAQFRNEAKSEEVLEEIKQYLK